MVNLKNHPNSVLITPEERQEFNMFLRQKIAKRKAMKKYAEAQKNKNPLKN